MNPEYKKGKGGSALSKYPTVTERLGMIIFQISKSYLKPSELIYPPVLKG